MKENLVNSPAVSVIMAAYNEFNVIEDAIKSIQQQTYDNWEMIIIDDNSTDGTFSILKKYSESESRLRIFKNEENLGLAASLNKAIHYSNANIIARMDADDYSFPNRLYEQVNFMEDHPEVVLLGTGAIYVNNKNNKERLVMMPEKHNEILCRIWKSSPFIHPSIVMRASFIQKLGGYSESLLRAQDYDLWFRGRNIGVYHNLQQALIKYNCVEKRSMRSLYDSFRVRKMHVQSLKEYSISFFWLFIGFCQRVIRS